MNDALRRAGDAHEDAIRTAYSSLDGKSPVKPTPFDAHEQATRGTHVPSEIDGPDKDPDTIEEFPKHVAGVIVNNAEEEKAALAEAAKAALAAAKPTQDDVNPPGQPGGGH